MLLLTRRCIIDTYQCDKVNRDILAQATFGHQRAFDKNADFEHQKKFNQPSAIVPLENALLNMNEALRTLTINAQAKVNT
jgi:hypothetical protein